MRIAIVTQGFESGGGVPTLARWLRGGLSDRGHEVHVHDVAASRRDLLSRRLLSPGTWRMRLAAKESAHDPGLFHWGADWVELESQRYRPRAALTATLNSYDLVQVVAGGSALGLAVSEVRPPKVLYVATTLLMERRAQLLEMPPLKRTAKTLSLRSLHRLEVKALRGVDEAVVINRWMERWVREQGQPAVMLAPPGIDTDHFHPIGDWDPGRPIIVFGRLGDSRKDWPTAVEAYELFVAETGLGNGLVLAGKGPVHPALQRKLAASPVRDRITIHEDVPAGELPSLLASGSVFLQSSLEEGLGLAGLEAMACGLPVVATATVGAKEYVVNGVNGFLIEICPGSAALLSQALSEVLSGGADGVGARLSRDAIRTCMDGYSSRTALESFIDLYQALASK